MPKFMQPETALARLVEDEGAPVADRVRALRMLAHPPLCMLRRLLHRSRNDHLGFLAALFIAQTMALNFRPNLPAHWITPSSRDASPFALIVGVLCACLAIVQILTNRSLLDRAHNSAQLESAL